MFGGCAGVPWGAGQAISGQHHHESNYRGNGVKPRVISRTTAPGGFVISSSINLPHNSRECHTGYSKSLGRLVSRVTGQKNVACLSVCVEGKQEE